MVCYMRTPKILINWYVKRQMQHNLQEQTIHYYWMCQGVNNDLLSLLDLALCEGITHIDRDKLDKLVAQINTLRYRCNVDAGLSEQLHACNTQAVWTCRYLSQPCGNTYCKYKRMTSLYDSISKYILDMMHSHKTIHSEQLINYICAYA